MMPFDLKFHSINQIEEGMSLIVRTFCLRLLNSKKTNSQLIKST